MTTEYATPEDYLAQLPEERRLAIESVRKVILANKPVDVEEGMQHGSIAYFVPHSVYPPGYHCDPKQPLPFAGLASQKNHMSLYLFCLYAGGELVERFRDRYVASGKKLDMGASCVRFKKLADLPLEVIGETLKEISLEGFLAKYESMKPPNRKH